jgi:NAD(P)H-hydrate epimerase
MFIDKSSIGNTVIQSNTTLTFQCLKLCFLVAENAGSFGNVQVLDIGLHPKFLETVSSPYQLISQSTIQQIYRPRKAFSHKGSFGHALIIAGNKGKMGAALMAAQACLRTGAGLTTVNVPEEFLNTVHAYLPEVMCQTREEGLGFDRISAVGIGPGLGTERDAEDLLHQTLLQLEHAIVIDADALNVLSDHKSWLKQIPESSILTPHPKEFERLFGNAENDFERISMAFQNSAENNFIIILKGRYSFIATNGEGFFNTTGNAGLAKGGSGDILTGIITALLAQKYSPLEATLLGVYIHGLAADIALEKQSMESLIASDVIKYLGRAFRTLYN